MVDNADTPSTDLVPVEAAPRTPVGTDFKAVAIGVGTNLEPLPAYFVDPLLQTGNMPGIAISAFNNRALRQGTFVASSLCLWMSDEIQTYIPDNGDQIAWIGEWTQSLSNFVLQLIPPGPNLGAYLPLAGGQMSGNITFVSGISTILSNNTWYYARDAAGTARGLILKGSDNNVYINDGSASYVHIHGNPVADNNLWWAGTDTGGTIHGIIGLLSDNNVHVGGSYNNIMLDCNTGAAIYAAGSIVIPNNRWYYAADTGGTNHPILGISNGNSCLVGNGSPGSTDIYAAGGNSIYLHNTTFSLGVHQINGYTYMNGGGRCYIPGGNDPFQIYADNGYYSRVHFVVGGTRDWSCGSLNSGVFAIADESAHAIRWSIDLSGTVTVNNFLSVGGGSHIYNGLTVDGGITSNGGLSVNSTAWIYGGLNIWNGVSVNSGDINCNGSMNAGGNQTNNYLHCYGNADINGHCNVYNALDVSGFGGTGYGIYAHSTHIGADGSIHAGADLTGNGSFFIANNGGVGAHLSVANGFCLSGSNFNFDYTWAAPIAGHFQMVGGLGMYAQFFAPYSDMELKRNIEPVEHNALAAIKPLRFYSYDVPRTNLGGEEIIDERSHVAVGLLAQQVRESLADAVIETEQPVKFHMDHTIDHRTGEVGCEFETRPALALDIMTMLAYSLRAIQQLVDRVEQLEAGRA